MDKVRKIIREQLDMLNEATYTLYHGTNNVFDKFDLSRAGENTQASWNGFGIYFSDNKAEASLYGDKIVVAKVRIDNPIDLTEMKDTSVQGSGLVRLFAMTKGLDELSFKGKTYKELNALLDDLEQNFDYSKISFSEGIREWFKDVWYEHTDGKEYVLRSRNKNEYDNKEYLRNLIISNILHDKYEVFLPIRISEAISPYLFTEIAMKNGYDGVIAPNSTVASGNEYVVFSPDQIEILKPL